MNDNAQINEIANMPGKVLAIGETAHLGNLGCDGMNAAAVEGAREIIYRREVFNAAHVNVSRDWSSRVRR